MTGLSTKQKSFIKTMTEDEEYERRGFELLAKRPDLEKFFDALTEAGLFDAARNLGPVAAEEPGYYRLPYWNALVYLEAAAKRAGETDDVALAGKVMNVVREVSRWRDSDGRIRDNESTWHAFATIFGLMPLSAVSLDDIDLMPAWFEGRFSLSRVGAAFAHGPLKRFVASERPEDWSKACRILFHCTAIRWVDKKRRDGSVDREATTVVDDFWLKELINASATALGAKAGQDAADVFLTRLHDLCAQDMEGGMTFLTRPAIEEHPQNHSWEGPPNRFAEGLRNALLGWVDHDTAGARPFVERLLRDDSEMGRRVAIHTVNERFDSLHGSVPLLFRPEIFDTAHLHELYVLLKGRFRQFTEEEKEATVATIRAIPLPEKGDDPQRLLGYVQRQWLSAIAGQGYDPADRWFQELNSDGTLGGLSPHPDFHSYMEQRWGSGPTPHSVQELVAFAEAGTVVDRLNAFTPGNFWDGPSTRSLADAVIEAVGLAPRLFLDLLPSFLKAKREYQYAVIAGLKKLWDAWDGKQAGLDWNDAWPKLIGFFENIVGDPRFWSEQVMEDGSLSPNRNWIPATISEFLRAGTRNDEKAYAPDSLPRTWSLIKILLRDTEAQQEASEGDALNKAINTSKGKAIEALFNHALRWCRVSDAETKSHAGTWRDMQPVFDEEIAACRNKNFEFSALAGSYITNLQYLDSDWLHNNFRAIFPIDFPANCLAALDGLAFGTATEAIYTELVDTGIVVWALNQELKGGRARENLVQRMCLAYLWNKEELDSPRFAVLFNTSHTDDLEIACKYFWAIRGQPLTDDQNEKILLFWGRSVTRAANVEPAPAKLLSALSLLSCHLKSVGPRELAWLLAVAPHISVSYNADFFIEELGRLVDISPLQVGNVLATALQTHKPLSDYEDRLKILVTKLAERPETRPDALRCAERLRYIPGMVQLYAQLISDSGHRA
jgi:hypothetical protein